MSSRRRPFRRLTLAAVASALTLSACAEDAPQDFLEPEGPIARSIHNLATPVFLIAGVVFVFVMGLVLVTIVKFRSKGDDDAPRQIHGSTKLEIGWTIAPAAVLALVGVLTVAKIFDLDERPQGRPIELAAGSSIEGQVLEVNVYGHRFWWEYEYPQLGITTANELVIPVDIPVYLTLTANEPAGIPEHIDRPEGDGVIHSYWVPKLAGKQDVVPGRESHITLQADEPDRYLGQCAEFCGASHANMRLVVDARTAEDFAAWAEGQKAEAAGAEALSGDAAEGYELFAAKGCVQCHTIAGREDAQATIGPDLTHLYSRETFAGSMFALNDQRLRAWLRDPQEEKPGNNMVLTIPRTEDEITKLIAYLKTLQ